MKKEITDNYSLLLGDNIQWLKTLPGDSVDSVLTDPPYGLRSIVKRFGKANSKDAQFGTDGVFKRSSKGFMGKEWDSDVPSVEFWREVYRILKPGGHILSFGGTRTYHRMATAIEDAGFEIRDQLQWIYGSGFPKSHNIGKAIDKRTDWSQYDNFKKMLKKRREELGLSQLDAYKKCKFSTKTFGGNSWFENGKIPSKKDYLLLKKGLLLDDKFDSLFEEVHREFIEVRKNSESNGNIRFTNYGEWNVTKGNSEWENWGTNLKPANEPICLARKPLSERTIAENVLKWGTGGINIGRCRIGNELRTTPIHSDDVKVDNTLFGLHKTIQHERVETTEGRFPSNIMFDEEAGKILDEQSGILTSGKMKSTHIRHTDGSPNGIFGKFNPYHPIGETYGDSGGASRFFYCPKVSKKERDMGLEDFDEKHSIQKGHGLDRICGNCGAKMLNPQDCICKEPNWILPPKKNSHPTVKPINLMSYLVKLITPIGGTVLDPFMGSGSGGIATLLEGFNFIGMEQDSEYFEIATARIKEYESYRKILTKPKKTKREKVIVEKDLEIGEPVMTFWLNQAV
jgi:DNA modification methylase